MKPTVETVKLGVIRGRIGSMSTLTITEFLEARIADDEARAGSGWTGLGHTRWETDNYGRDHLTPLAVLAECAAKRAIIGANRGESWNVPQPPNGDHNTYVTTSDNPHEVRVKLDGTFVETISREEYFKRMGATKNPPAVELRALAAVYASHPAYRQEWAL